MQDAEKSQLAETLVSKFKDGTLSRTAVFIALHKLFSALPPAGDDGTAPTPPTDEEVESFVEPFVDMCDQWSRDQEAAKRNGKKRARAGASGGGNAETGAGAGSNGDGDGSDEDDEDEPAAKRRANFEEDELPWVRMEAATGSLPLRADLTETIRLLGIYGVDPKRALRSLLARTRVEFPESQWLRLLTNKAIDLDIVLSSIYSLVPGNTHTETIGAVELTFNSASKATRSVATQAEWTLAWMRAVQAILAVFPHLHEQLRAWGVFILAKFASIHESHHRRVISFEKAARLLASRRADVALDQFYQFTELETMHLNSLGSLAMGGNDGGGSSRSKTSGNGGGKRSGGTKSTGVDGDKSANTSTFAPLARAPIVNRSVRVAASEGASSVDSVAVARPRYLRSVIWSDG